MTGVALRDTGLALSDLLALARAADDVGYASLWAPEVGSRDALALAALYGDHTRRIAVGTGVVPVYARNAVALSLAAAAASEASEGRFILGLGAGHRYAAEAWFDGRWRRPRQRMRETIEVVRRILAGERVSHDGEFKVDAFHLGSAPPPIPVYLAALTPASLRLAGEVADGAILNWLPAQGVERSGLLVREAAADAGRTVHVIAYVRVAVTNGEDEQRIARTAVREHTYAYASLPAYANSLRQVGLGPAVDKLADGNERALDALVDSLCAVGPEAEVRDRLDGFTKAGLDSVVVYPVPYGDDPAGSILRTIRALAP